MRPRAPAHFLIHLPLLLVLAIGLRTGLVGLDFGPHWDDPWNREGLERVVETQTFLQGRYDHAFVQFDLALVSVGLEAAALALRADPACSAGWFACFTAAVKAPGYILPMRRLFLVITLLAPLFVYLLVWRWRRSALEAGLAAGILGLSWEFAYHARWVAPDNVLLMFAALVALCLVCAREAGAAVATGAQPQGATSRGGLWLKRAAAAAGLGLATKYPGGLLLLPVLVFALAGAPGAERPAQRLRLALACGAWFAVAALAVSPGAYLQPLRLAFDLQDKIRQYRTGHVGYTIASGLTHFAAMWTWFTAVFDSPSAPAAVFLCAPAALGAVELVRSERKFALVWLVFPVVFLAYFSTQRVMIVRNVLCVAPFLAVLSARGFGLLWQRLPRPAGAAVLALALACLAGNAVFLERAARSVRDRASVDPFAVLAQYQAGHAGALVVSPFVRSGLAAGGRALQTLPARAAPPDALAVFSSLEVNGAAWRLNRRGRYLLLPTGPFEVNWDYYATWIASPRLVFARVDEARAMGIPLAD